MVTNFTLHLQAFLQLSEVYPAVKAARKCVELNPRWWVGFQTLGRAQLALGEVKLVCFLNASVWGLSWSSG